MNHIFPMIGMIIRFALFFIPVFIPFYIVFLLLQDFKRHNNVENKVLVPAFIVFGLKELFQFVLVFYYVYVMTDLDAKFSYHSLYNAFFKQEDFPLFMPLLAYVWDLFVLGFFMIPVFKFLEIRKIEVITAVSINVLVVGLLLFRQISGQEGNFILLMRLFFLANLGYMIIRLQKGYFEQGLNFINQSKGMIALGLLFLIPGLLANIFNTNLIGQIFRAAFYFFVASPALLLIRMNSEKRAAQIRMIEKEKNVIEKLLHNIGSSLAANEDQQTILDMIIAFATDVTEARAGSILLFNKKKTQLYVATVHGFYPPVHSVDGVTVSKEKFLVDRFKSESIEPGQTYLGKVVQTHEPVFVRNAMEDPEIIQSARGVMDILSVIYLPLMVEDEVLGVLSVLNKTNGVMFTDEDFRLVQSLGDQAAVALNTVKLRNEYQEKLQSEKQLAMAAQIQQGLLPKTFPVFPTLEIFGFSKPAKGVGGDYYDAIQFDDHHLGVCIADVAGKGVPAALVMVMIRSALRTIASANVEPKRIVAMVNNGVAGEVTQERYATMFYFVFNTQTGLLSYSNAAHGPLLVYRSGTDTFELLDTVGLPVGIEKNVEYGQDETVLNSGDIAMLYTDGITEAMNEKHDEYSLARVKNDIRELKDLSGKEIGKEILARVEAFAGEEPQHDDETLLIFKIKEAALPE